MAPTFNPIKMGGDTSSANSSASSASTGSASQASGAQGKKKSPTGPQQTATDIEIQKYLAAQQQQQQQVPQGCGQQMDKMG